MNNEELEKQCKAFRRTLEAHCGSECYDPRLDDDFVRSFNAFVAEHPRVLEWKVENGQSLLTALYWYLNRAIFRRFPLDTFRALVSQTPRVLAEKRADYGFTLLHDVCGYDRYASEIVSFFVQQDPDSVKAVDSSKKTPLHFAYHNGATLPVIEILVDAYPRAIEICDRYGDTPLHEACYWCAQLDGIQYSVKQRPNVCLYQNKDGKMPVDKAEGSWLGINTHVLEFMTTATTAVARLSMKRLCFNNLPREIFEQVAAYLHGGGPVVEAPLVNLALSRCEIAVLFRRGDVRAEFRDEI